MCIRHAPGRASSPTIYPLWWWLLLFIILTGTVNIFISTEIQNLAESLSVLGNAVKHLIIISIKFVPFVSTWLLFFVVYMVMPNTRVKIRAALLAGIIAGTFFQLFQWGYIEFQVGVSRSNAIYGSLLPSRCLLPGCILAGQLY